MSNLYGRWLRKKRSMKKFNLRDPLYYSVIYEHLVDHSKPRIILQNKSIYNEKIVHLTDKFTFFDFYKENLKQSFIAKEDKPHMICMSCASLDHLETLKYSEETINFLNEKGLDIYLYENIFIDLGPEKRTKVHELAENNNISKDDAYEKIKNSITGFESSQENLEKMYCFEFESITKFAKNNNLKHVRVLTGDYKVEEYFQDKYPTIQIKNKDICTASMFGLKEERFNAYQYILEPTHSPSVDKIQHKFLCFNRRYTAYRHLIASYLVNKSSLLSFQWEIEDSPFEIFDDRTEFNQPLWGSIEKYLWFDLEDWKHLDIYETIKQGMTELEKGPRNIDVDITDETSPEVKPVPLEIYQSCFLSVVTEEKYTRPTGSFSEKTLNPIKCFSPFLLIAPPNTLSYLKDFGIKTFDDFWDESYDKEINHEKRLLKVMSVIDHINSKELSELKEMYQNMIPILMHNYKQIYTIKDKNGFE